MAAGRPAAPGGVRRGRRAFGAEEYEYLPAGAWLQDIATRFRRYLAERGYRREPGTLSSAYAPHDVRAEL